MKGYKEIAEVDWVQLRAPRSVEQMKLAREAVGGPFSIMQAYILTRFSPTKDCST